MNVGDQLTLAQLNNITLDSVKNSFDKSTDLFWSEEGLLVMKLKKVGRDLVIFEEERILSAEITMEGRFRKFVDEGMAPIDAKQEVINELKLKAQRAFNGVYGKLCKFRDELNKDEVTDEISKNDITLADLIN